MKILQILQIWNYTILENGEMRAKLNKFSRPNDILVNNVKIQDHTRKTIIYYFAPNLLEEYEVL